mgnify:CR=1 FL=1
MIQKWTKTEHLKIFNGLIRDFKGYYSCYTPVKILSTKMQKFEKKNDNKLSGQDSNNFKS